MSGWTGLCDEHPYLAVIRAKERHVNAVRHNARHIGHDAVDLLRRCLLYTSVREAMPLYLRPTQAERLYKEKK